VSEKVGVFEPNALDKLTKNCEVVGKNGGISQRTEKCPGFSGGHCLSVLNRSS